MRNKLTRRKDSGVTEVIGRGSPQRDGGPSRVCEYQTAPEEGPPPERDHTEYERHRTAPCATQKRVMTGVHPPQTEGSDPHKPQTSRVMRSLSASDQLSCLEEIKLSNPTFPARTVFRFLKRKSSEQKSHLLSPGGPRTRPHEATVPGGRPKRLREAVFQQTPPGGSSEAPAPSRLSRTQRLKHLRRASGRGDPPPPLQNTQSEEGPASSDPRTAGVEDVLWTEKYSPQRSSEVIGNSGSVNKLHSWLKRWRRSIDGCGRREEEEGMRTPHDEGSWDRGDFQGEAGSEGRKVGLLPSTLLITGPPGVGKTASVYACAMELGFKVLEVNCSSQRSRRCVLAALTEVTQSHLVEGPAPCSPCPPLRPAAGPGRNASPAPASFCRRGGRPDPGGSPGLASFLRTGQTPAKHRGSLDPAPGPQEGGRRAGAGAALLLFEEVDIVFQEDVGFLSAVRTLMSSTKRPVVLTTSDPSFKERFDRHVEEILFKTPSKADLCSYLRLVCAAERAWTGPREVEGLLEEFQGDLRRCLIQLHFLVKSLARPRRTGPPGQALSGPECCCPPSASGLNALSRQKLRLLLQVQSWAEPDGELLPVLTESWRRHFPLLYSNLQWLLPPPPSTQATQTENADLCSASCVRNSSRLSRRRGLLSVSERGRTSPHHRVPPQRTDRPASPGRGVLGAVDGRRDGGARPSGLGALAYFADLMSYLDSTLAAAEPHVPGPQVSRDLCWTGAELSDGVLDEQRQAGGERPWRQQEGRLEMQAAAEALGFQVCRGGWPAGGSGAPTCDRGDGGARREEALDTLARPGASDGLSSRCPLLPQPSAARRRFELSRAVLQNPGLGLLGSRGAVCLDHLSTLRYFCRRQQHNRCSYLRSIHLGLSRATMRQLAEDCMT